MPGAPQKRQERHGERGEGAAANILSTPPLGTRTLSTTHAPLRKDRGTGETQTDGRREKRKESCCCCSCCCCCSFHAPSVSRLFYSNGTGEGSGALSLPPDNTPKTGKKNSPRRREGGGGLETNEISLSSLKFLLLLLRESLLITDALFKRRGRASLCYGEGKEHGWSSMQQAMSREREREREKHLFRFEKGEISLPNL